MDTFLKMTSSTSILHVLCNGMKIKIICSWTFGICQLLSHVIARKGFCWGTWEATVPFAHWHHCYDWEFVHSIMQRLIYFTVSYGSFMSFCIQFVCCRHIGLDECRQEVYFIILKTFKLHMHNKYWQGGEMKSLLHLRARVTNCRRECVGEVWQAQ